MKRIFFILFACLINTLSWGQFGPLNDLSEGELSIPNKILLEDLDMDGDQDILLLTFAGVLWKENLGFETFSELQLIGTLSENPTDFIMFDFDLDGDNDILAYNTGAFLVRFFRNTGGEVFEGVDFMPGFEFYSRFESSDIDLDGDPEFVGLKLGGIFAITPDGLGGIEDETNLVSGTFPDPTDLMLFDMDNDLDPDLIWCNLDGFIFYSENLGGGIFAIQDTVVSGANPFSSVYAADVDGDLDLDILSGSFVIEGEGTIQWYENLGAGTFGPAELISSDVMEHVQVFTADVDLDGDPDLLSSSFGDDKIAWYENLGGGVFGDQTIISNEMDGAIDLKVMDMDADGDLDVFAISESDSKVAWFENQIIDPSIVNGRLYIDENENGILDGDEVGMPFTSVFSDPVGALGITHSDGTYLVSFDGVPEDTYTIFPELENWYITSTPSTYTVENTDPFVYMSDLDFGLFPDTEIDTVSTNLINPTFPRCNTNVPYWISVKNEGTTHPSGILHLALDDSLTFIASEITPDSIVGQNLYWSYADLFFFETESFRLTVFMPDGFEDTVHSVLTTTIVEDDAVIFTVSDSVNEVVSCAYDPNDKTVDPAGETDLGLIPQETTWMEYTVRFQNTGTDTAFKVVVRDQLDENLDWLTFEPLVSSHDMFVDFDPSGELDFVFEDILLPDSATNPIGSNGFFTYRIKLKEELPYGTVIENTANIYFDFNPPITTNTTVNTIAEPDNTIHVENWEKNNVILYPNPTQDEITVYFSQGVEEPYTIVVYDLLGHLIYESTNQTGQKTLIPCLEFGSGVYVLTVSSALDGRHLFQGKVMVE